MALGTSNDTIVVLSTLQPDSNEQNASIISISVLGGLLIFGLVGGWILYKKCCKSHRSKYADDEKEEKKKMRVTEYYDQFNVDDDQNLTASSRTVKHWTEDEKASSGVDCGDSFESGEEVGQIDTGKRVFTVNKVTEWQRQSSTRSMVVKVPKGMLHSSGGRYSSLQAKDGRQYTLALIDNQSMTIHNLEPQCGRSIHRIQKRAASSQSVPLVISPRAYSCRRKRRLYKSQGGQSQSSSAATEYMHDSTDDIFSSQQGVVTSELSTTSLTERSDSSSGNKDHASTTISIESLDVVSEKVTVA